MSTLISSATSGKKAAPKAPPRRRPAGGGAPTLPAPAPAPRPIWKRVGGEPVAESSTSQTTVEQANAPPTPPSTQQVRPTTETHVRFAEPVTSTESSSQPASVNHAQATAITSTTEPAAPAASSTSNNISPGPDVSSLARAQSSSASQEPVLHDNALFGYTHVRGGTPPPAYSPDVAPVANDNATSSNGRAVADVVAASPQPTGVAEEANQVASGAPQLTEDFGSTNTEPQPSIEATSSTTSRPAKRGRQTDPAEPQARKAPKRNSTRSNAMVQAQLEESAVAGPSQTPRRPPVARMMATTQDSSGDATTSDLPQTEDAAAAAAAPKKPPAKRKPRKVKTPARVDEEEPAEGQEGEEAVAKPKKPRKPRQQKAAPKPRAKKAATKGDGEGELQNEDAAEKEEPESDPELHEIDPEALSMYTITKSTLR